ncbi:hypothetical protein [Pseudoxanthomonas japonensis]|uniref:hypothetical protein n=1 Tax=Pseudoxanthomonas japonensis TaxID=69284 RepID=UPI001BCF6BC0|nr:hypothetical protein [Pseudoxanthomonas japonensis]
MNASNIEVDEQWKGLYEASEDFRAKYEEMYLAVESLPEGLIERGRNLEYPQLHNACLEVDFELVKGLLEAGASADSYTYTEGDTDTTPLVWLAESQMDSKDKLSLARLLVRYGADVNEGDALAAARDWDDEDFVDFLVEAGATD